jgi:hypothetical protein
MGLEREGLFEGERLEREGMKELCLSLTFFETCRFTVPPAVALNY